jgi:Ankyrin repeats (many copies)
LQYGCTLLYKAVGRGNIPLAKDLINRGANVNIKNLEGNTPLLFALGRGYRELALLLIDAGADIDVKDRVRIPFVAVLTVSMLPAYLFMLSERLLKDFLQRIVTESIFHTLSYVWIRVCIAFARFIEDWSCRGNRK